MRSLPSLLRAGLLALAVSGIAAQASAQLTSAQLPSVPVPATFVTDSAYDPVHHVSLVVTSGGVVSGLLVSSTTTMTAPLPIAAPSAGYEILTPARVAYSGDLDDGAGGQGGFLVIWAEQAAGGLGSASVRGQIVAADGRLVGGAKLISAAFTSLASCTLAYSPSRRTFLAAWAGKSGAGPTEVFAQPLSLTGDPIGPAGLVVSGAAGPQVAWNATSNEFGIALVGGATAGVGLARISADGAVAGIRYVADAYNSGLGLAVNRRTGQYLMLWQRDGTSVTAAVLSSLTDVLSVADVIAFPAFTSSGPVRGSLTDVAYGESSDTFAVTGVLVTPQFGGFSFRTLWVFELDGQGTPVGSLTTISTFSVAGRFFCVCTPTISAMESPADWLVSLIRAFPDPILNLWTIDTAAQAVEPPAPPPVVEPCTTPDPFVVLGGGVCVSGGWVPKGHPLAAQPTSPPGPGPAPTGCITPDPFVSLGGGTCVSGGWVPKGHPLASPPTNPPGPAPAPSGCATPDPFQSLPTLVGKCVDGGWRPVPGVKTAGTIVYPPDIGGGLVALIEGDDGGVYQPQAFDGDLSAGRVFIEAEIVSGAVSVHPRGVIVTIRRLERLH